jgi:hypothetical protein
MLIREDGKSKKVESQWMEQKLNPYFNFKDWK